MCVAALALCQVISPPSTPENFIFFVRFTGDAEFCVFSFLRLLSPLVGERKKIPQVHEKKITMRKEMTERRYRNTYRMQTGFIISYRITGL